MIKSWSVRVEGSDIVADMLTQPEGPNTFVQLMIEGFPLVLKEAGQETTGGLAWHIRKTLPMELVPRSYLITAVEVHEVGETVVQDDFVSTWVSVGSSALGPVLATSLVGLGVAAVALRGRKSYGFS